jgi:ADP-heptose:LPS heptosyltransferase
MIVRLDNIGDVLLAGPAVRAVAAGDRTVTMLASTVGAAGARLLPGVADVITFDAPWVGFGPPDVDRAEMSALVSRLERVAADDAIILTSFHQSPLPIALLMRMAGVGRIAATCVDYPGRLLDIRHPYQPDLHEVEQALSVCAAAGYRLPPGDDHRLRVDLEVAGDVGGSHLPEPYVVVHPGASVAARALPVDRTAETIAALVEHGRRVVVTGSPGEVDLARRVAPVSDGVTIAAGQTDLAGLIRLIAGADAVVCGNTGTAHVAAAVGTPVIEAFAPVVPAHRWLPWMVPHVLLGRLDIACAGCRARACPLPGQPCLEPFTAEAVLDALGRVGRRRPARSLAGGAA